MDFDLRAEAIVTTYIEEHLDKTDVISDFEVFIVWKCKTLQNWKYLLSSTLFDGIVSAHFVEKLEAIISMEEVLHEAHIVSGSANGTTH